MAHLARAAFVLLLAVVTARASVEVSWNVRSAHPAPTSAPARTALVAAVHGTSVILRLPDGTTRAYVATPQQASALRARVGGTIRFIAHPLR